MALHGDREHYTLKEIENALRHKENLTSIAELGTLEAIERGIDAERCLRLAQPTEVQERCINLVWRQNRSLAESGRILGVTPQAVKFNIDLLRVKMKKVLDKWKALDEEDLY